MIQIHATKKLLAKMPAQTKPGAEDILAAPQSKLGSWHANLLTIQRRNCLLFVHDQTRFPLFIPALTKPDLANIDWCFEDVLMNTLLKCNATEKQRITAAALLQPLAFVGGTDRSVLGTLNRTAQDIEHSIYFDSLDVAELTGYSLSAWMAQRPCMVKNSKDFIMPGKAFLAMLDDLHPGKKPTGRKKAEQEPLPDNVVMLDLFRDDNEEQ
ncbi:MAG: hypothetical protein CMI08_06435 [Oceanospirillaceae bacterium]|uniref:DUF6933 domain-containing protein n=1 Tax=unclassified Thalassolituus TaxID=2624967 RepID=UPI000C40DCEF|nr:MULTISPECIES: hypothetical protein [unclassified Thalassolituus]MAS25197.1 hypothetical protein [Oceanospirillaceae bacterium]MAX98831.1 hypothetical protein [Oceanospirillaceae bacterium]MBS53940.1 hypothetical protein [Oceanospirillaceae bacterium]|tara:strand:- start:1164 stop:1796 length:633 start_codon:yes stop_codon:yes gene_type:complete